MTPLFEAILEHMPAPDVDPEGPLQFQISTLDYSTMSAASASGASAAAGCEPAHDVAALAADAIRQGLVTQVLRFAGLERMPVEEAAPATSS